MQDGMLQFTSLLLRKSSPGRAQDAPRRPRRPQETPQSPPRHPQDAPRRAQDASQDAPRRAQDAPKRAQEAPRHAKDAPIGSKSRPGLLQTSILDNFGNDFGPFLEDSGRTLQINILCIQVNKIQYFCMSGPLRINIFCLRATNNLYFLFPHHYNDPFNLRSSC